MRPGEWWAQIQIQKSEVRTAGSPEPYWKRRMHLPTALAGQRTSRVYYEYTMATCEATVLTAEHIAAI
jgi:hypothetical protein